MDCRGFESWGFRRVRGGEAYAVVRVFQGTDGKLLAYQRWDRNRATPAELELADLRCSLDPPLEEGDLQGLPELPADLAMNGPNTDIAARFIGLFLADPSFSRLVSDALSDWDDFQTTGSPEARALFEMAVREAADLVAVEGSGSESAPEEEGGDTEVRTGTEDS